MSSREYLVEQQILTYLSNLGIGFFWKNVSSGFNNGERFIKHKSPFAINGTSDVLGILNCGRFVALEVKDKGKPSPEQLAFIAKVRALGGIGAVVRSCDQVREALQSGGLCIEESLHAHAISKSHVS